MMTTASICLLLHLMLVLVLVDGFRTSLGTKWSRMALPATTRSYSWLSRPDSVDRIVSSRKYRKQASPKANPSPSPRPSPRPSVSSGWKINSSKPLRAKGKNSFINKPAPLPPAKPKFVKEKDLVERPIPLYSNARKSLALYRAGDKVRGRVISFTGFGMYVDVGTIMDGLVHVKDASDTYFVSSLTYRYSLGQDIDVWVKFVDAPGRLLGLQLFPPMPELPKVFDFNDLEIGQRVSGRITKFSQYGAFVDIGADVTAFMPRGKMRCNRRQRSYQPWEVASVGDEMDFYVYRVILDRRRVVVTAYPPEVWKRQFLERPPEDIEESYKSDDDILRDELDDNRQREKDRMEAMGELDEDQDQEDSGDEFDEDLDEDDDGDDYEDEDREDGAEFEDEDEPSGIVEEDTALTADEVMRLSGRELVIDDFADRSRGVAVSPASSGGRFDYEKQKVSNEDIFLRLSGGKAFLGLSHIKRWFYIRRLRASGLMSNLELKELFADAGAKAGKLNLMAFDNFMEMLEDPEPVEDYEYADNAETEQIAEQLEAATEFDIDAEEVLVEDHDGVDDEGMVEPTVGAVPTSHHDENNAFAIFRQLANNKGKITVEILMNWAVSTALIRDGKLTEQKLRDLVKHSGNGKTKPRQSISKKQFVNFLRLLREYTGEGIQTAGPEQEMLAIEGSLPEMRFPDDVLSLQAQADANYAEESAEGLEHKQLLSMAFDSMAGAKGYVSVENLMNWDFVTTSMEKGVLREDELKEKVARLSSKENGGRSEGLDPAGLDQFVDGLIALHETHNNGNSH